MVGALFVGSKSPHLLWSAFSILAQLGCFSPIVKSHRGCQKDQLAVALFLMTVNVLHISDVLHISKQKNPASAIIEKSATTLENRALFLVRPAWRGKESPMEIIALLAGIATIISTIVGVVGIVVKYRFRFAYWLQKLRAPKRSKKWLDRDFEGMMPLNLPSLRPRRRQNSFGQVVDQSPPVRWPKAVWPPSYEKAIVNTDFMVRGPHPTTDSARPFASRGGSSGVQPGRSPSNFQSD